jgi:hypothetical protein
MFDPPPDCLECGEPMKKVITAPAVKMRRYLPLMEQEDGKMTSVTERVSRNHYFETKEESALKNRKKKKSRGL